MKKIKKSLSFFLTLALMLSAFSFTAFANAQADSCGENLEWTLEEGVLTISGTGEMTATPWEDQKDSIEKVVIGKGVTSILDGAFVQYTNLVEFIVDEENTAYSSLEGGLFNKDKTEFVRFPCGSPLEEYHLPLSVNKIGDEAFAYCKNIVKATNGGSITSLGERSFYDCDKLNSYHFCTGLKYIGKYAFADCDSLPDAFFHAWTVTIEEGAFSGCDKLSNIFMNYCHDVNIGDFAFADCPELWRLVLNMDKKFNIGKGAFVGCPKLVEFEVLTRDFYIGEKAFGYMSFDGDEKVENFTIIGYKNTDVESYTSENGFTFLDFETFPEYIDFTTYTLPNVRERTTVEFIEDRIKNNFVHVQWVYDKDRNLLHAYDILGTGSFFTRGDEGGCFTVIVKGDVDGTGTVDSADYLRIKSQFYNGEALTGVFYTAADVDNNGTVNTTDYLKVKSYFLGIYDLYA